MEETIRYSQEHPYIVLLTSISISLIIGLIPLILGILKKKRNLGIIAFAVALLLSLVPILSIISSTIFSVVIYIKSKSAGTSEEPVKTSNISSSENL